MFEPVALEVLRVAIEEKIALLFLQHSEGTIVNGDVRPVLRTHLSAQLVSGDQFALSKRLLAQHRVPFVTQQAFHGVRL